MSLPTSPRSKPKVGGRSNSHPSPNSTQQNAAATSPPPKLPDQKPPPGPQLPLKKLKDKVAYLERENARLQKSLGSERNEAERQNIPRDVQLEGLKEYLDTHDKCSPAEVLSKLDLVNDLVDQLASDISDQFQTATSPKPSESNLARNMGELKFAFGPKLVEILDVCDPTDPNVMVLFQYAVQTAMLFEVHKLCDVDFCFRSDEPKKHILHVVSKYVQKKEIQPIYGRWRALTHRHLRTSEDQEVANQRAMAFVTKLTGIFVDIQDAIHGVQSTPGQRSQSSPHIEGSLRELYRQAQQLSAMIKEEVISTDFIVFAPWPGRPFRPERMEFPYETSGDDGPPTSDVVISTVKLGLLAYGKPGREDVPAEFKVKKKAQVFTEHVRDVILGPTKPNP